MEVHDLHVALKNIARVSVLCRIAVPGDMQEQAGRRTRMSDEYHHAVHHLRGRAIARLNEKMTQVEAGTPGAIQVKRLRAIRDRLAVDPFAGLEVDLNADEVDEESASWELEKEPRKQFSLRRKRCRVVLGISWHLRHLCDSRKSAIPNILPTGICPRMRRHVHADH